MRVTAGRVGNSSEARRDEGTAAVYGAGEAEMPVYCTHKRYLHVVLLASVIIVRPQLPQCPVPTHTADVAWFGPTI